MIETMAAIILFCQPVKERLDCVTQLSRTVELKILDLQGQDGIKTQPENQIEGFALVFVLSDINNTIKHKSTK